MARFQFQKGVTTPGFNPGAGVDQIFATPEFLERLRAEILALEQADRGLTVSNFGGWHSRTNLFDQKSETIAALREAALAAVAEITYEQIRKRFPACDMTVQLHGGAWANVSRAGDYNKVHNHPGAMWSGVFYVAMGNRDPEPAGSGCLEFVDPRSGNQQALKIVIDPKPGQILIFPAWLYHYVNPFRGAGERISVAFNATVDVSKAKDG